jgi:hypothetical protein
MYTGKCPHSLHVSYQPQQHKQKKYYKCSSAFEGNRSAHLARARGMGCGSVGTPGSLAHLPLLTGLWACTRRRAGAGPESTQAGVLLEQSIICTAANVIGKHSSCAASQPDQHVSKVMWLCQWVGRSCMQAHLHALAVLPLLLLLMLPSAAHLFLWVPCAPAP